MKVKNIITGMLLLIFLISYDLSIAQEKNVLYTTIHIKVLKGKEKEFEKAVLAHNEKFHKDGIHQAFLRTILTGPEAGTYAWITGPKTFSDFDSAPGEGDHNDDWTNNVDQFVKDYGTVEHWKRNEKLSFIAPNTENNKMSEVWFIDIKDGKWEQFMDNLSKAIAVSTKKGDETVNTYMSSFSGGDGRDIALIFSKANWAAFDDDNNFSESYEELHGEGSWKEFMDNWTSSTDGIVQVVTQLIN